MPSGPVQEIEITQNIEAAVDNIPVPVSGPGFDSSVRLTAALWVTADPETGQRNVGIYSGYMQKGGRIGVGLGAGKDSRLHLDKCRERGIALKAAAIIGPTPNFIYAAAATLPRNRRIRHRRGIAQSPCSWFAVRPLTCWCPRTPK